MTPKHFKYSVRDGVGVLTLSRPDKLNAITLEAYAELRDWFSGLEGHAETRAVVLTGEGRGFCAGGDIHQIIGKLVQEDMAGLLRFTRMTCDLIRNICALRKPVIAAVNGAATGAGAVIAAACDIRIAAEGARFAFLFPKVGLSGADMGAAYLLPRIVGLGRASELLLTGDFVDAAEAHRIGLVNRVVPAGKLLAEAETLARRLADGPVFAHAMTKEMIHRELEASFDKALEWEAQAQAICMQTPDFREAYRAFVEKRDPRFQR
jgi:enoyl-CoA hydratase/carnithine racemase